ncbi:MAG: hypothetical protein RJA34_1733 [Pseudomonadota bacterium]|jgi:hypothetical protein
MNVMLEISHQHDNEVRKHPAQLLELGSPDGISCR